jgi:hypothetical protein
MPIPLLVWGAVAVAGLILTKKKKDESLPDLTVEELLDLPQSKISGPGIMNGQIVWQWVGKTTTITKAGFPSITLSRGSLYAMRGKWAANHPYAPAGYLLETVFGGDVNYDIFWWKRDSSDENIKHLTIIQPEDSLLTGEKPVGATIEVWRWIGDTLTLIRMDSGQPIPQFDIVNGREFVRRDRWQARHPLNPTGYFGFTQNGDTRDFGSDRNWVLANVASNKSGLIDPVNPAFSIGTVFP